MMIKLNDVVQFNEKHEWRGCLGIVTEVKPCRDDVRYMVEVLVPEQGATFMYVMKSENVIEYIGKALLIPPKEEDENE